MKAPGRRIRHAKGRAIAPKDVKAGAAAMSQAMMKKIPSPTKLRKAKLK